MVKKMFFDREYVKELLCVLAFIALVLVLWVNKQDEIKAQKYIEMNTSYLTLNDSITAK